MYYHAGLLFCIKATAKYSGLQRGISGRTVRVKRNDRLHMMLMLGRPTPVRNTRTYCSLSHAIYPGLELSRLESWSRDAIFKVLVSALRYWQKIANFSYPIYFNALAEGVPLGIWQSPTGWKLEWWGYQTARKSLTIYLAVLIQYTGVTDREMDGQRDTQRRVVLRYA